MTTESFDVHSLTGSKTRRLYRYFDRMSVLTLKSLCHASQPTL